MSKIFPHTPEVIDLCNEDEDKEVIPEPLCCSNLARSAPSSSSAYYLETDSEDEGEEARIRIREERWAERVPTARDVTRVNDLFDEEAEEDASTESSKEGGEADEERHRGSGVRGQWWRRRAGRKWIRSRAAGFGGFLAPERARPGKIPRPALPANGGGQGAATEEEKGVPGRFARFSQGEGGGCSAGFRARPAIPMPNVFPKQASCDKSVQVAKSFAWRLRHGIAALFIFHL
jgi:hypothetical protein